MNFSFSKLWPQIAVVLSVFVGVLFRFLYLDSDYQDPDPLHILWTGFVTDEGRWNEAARNLIQGRSLFNSSANLHLFVAPLFQLSNYIIYTFLDISRFSSRLFPAICGSLILIVFYSFMRKKVTPQALLFGISLLALQPDLIALSRVSIPESASMLFEFLVFTVLVSTNHSSLKMLLAGLLMLIVTGMKLTALPFLGILTIILLVIPYSQGTSERNIRYKRLAIFLSAILVPVIALGATLLGCCYDIDKVTSLTKIINTIKSFLGFSSLYQFISFPFESRLAVTFNVWCLGVALTFLYLLSDRRIYKDADISNKRPLLSAFIWFVTFFVMTQMMSYYYGRPTTHIFIPMALIVTFGVSHFQKNGIKNIVEFSSKDGAGIQLVKACCLALPMAIIVAPLFTYFPSEVMHDPVRLRHKILSELVMFLFIFAIIYTLRYNKRSNAFFLFFPVFPVFGFLFIQAFANGDYTFWFGSGLAQGYQATVWVATLIVSLIVALGVSKTYVRWDTIQRGRIVNIAAVLYLALFSTKIYPAYANPQYSVKNASISLGEFLKNEPRVKSANADGLFNDNSIYYEQFSHRDFIMGKPEIIVSAFDFHGDKDFLKINYIQIKKYQLYYSPKLKKYHPDMSNEVVVYKRIDDTTGQVSMNTQENKKAVLRPPRLLHRR